MSRDRGEGAKCSFRLRFDVSPGHFRERNCLKTAVLRGSDPPTAVVDGPRRRGRRSAGYGFRPALPTVAKGRIPVRRQAGRLRRRKNKSRGRAAVGERQQ
jgi:hypothetical protein